MTSAVDPGIITAAPVAKADMVAQLTTIRDEITALQNQFASIGGAGVLVARTVITGTPTTVDFVLPSIYTSFKLIGTTLYSASASFQVSLRTSTNNGASYAAGASDYETAYSFQSNTLLAGSVSSSSIILTESSAANVPHDFIANISPGDGAFGLRVHGTSRGLNVAGSKYYTGTFQGLRSAVTRATNIRVVGSVAFANSGVLTLIGIP